MSRKSSRFLSGGTNVLQTQSGATYPETFYSGNIPLDDKLYKQFLKDPNAGPIASGYATDTTYAQAGGMTDYDLMQMTDSAPCCDPMLPANQNLYSPYSHYLPGVGTPCCPLKASYKTCVTKKKAKKHLEEETYPKPMPEEIHPVEEEMYEEETKLHVAPVPAEEMKSYMAPEEMKRYMAPVPAEEAKYTLYPEETYYIPEEVEKVDKYCPKKSTMFGEFTFDMRMLFVVLILAFLFFGNTLF